MNIITGGGEFSWSFQV